MDVRFDGKVALVTGAGNGLGRSHALGLAARGAKVVVNDLGGARDGRGGSATAAEAVVEEIRAAGGEAVADGSSVTDAAAVERMVADTVERWGRLDIVVNNAGILRDKTFLKGSYEDFRAVLDVHLMGSVHCTRAAWPVMREQEYGRIVLTTSSSGLYGNFGQSNYGSAKMALVGLMNTLVLEGHKHGIRVNCLAPAAATRMTADLLPEQILALMEPEAVTAGLLHLVSEEAPNRTILAAGAGTFSVVRLVETAGIHLGRDDWTPEAVAARFAEITDPLDQRELTSGPDQTKAQLTRAAESLGIELG